MARSQADIVTDILAYKITQTALNGLNTTSAASIWLLFINIIAFAIWVHETLFDSFIAEVTGIASRAVPGTPEWYVQRTKEYRKGEAVQVSDEGVIAYTGVPPASPFITAAAVNVSAGTLIIKVAKGDPWEKLSNDSDPLLNEIVPLQGYLNRIKFAGTRLAVLSENPDVIDMAGVFYYDPQHDLQNVKDDLDAKVMTYLGQLPFDASINRNRLTDAIQTTLGYVDINLSVLQCQTAAGGTWFSINSSNTTYAPAAGYFQFNASQNPSDLLTFQAYVL
jgi:hypothetical protein